MATSSSLTTSAPSGPASATIATASASLVNSVHSPKSPCQQLSVHHSLSQLAHQQPISLSNVTPAASNLMSTSLNSSQLQSHTTGTNIGASGTSLSIHPSTSVHVPSGMSTSLHSGGGSGNITGGGFDNNGTAWNSTSSLSPSSSSAHHRKMEVKLNAMP